MRPFEALKPEEIKAITSYISCNIETEDVPSASTEYLLREWDSQKQSIFDAFGQKLIISKDISVGKTVEQISDEIARDYDVDKSIYAFERKWQNFCSQQRRDIYTYCQDFNNKELQGWYSAESILDSDTLASNSISEEFIVNLPKPDGSTRVYRVQKGSRPARVISRIMAAYSRDFDEEDKESFKKLCVWQSQHLNNKKLSGKLSISIHPLDYMTMSDNENDWESCMSWRNNGCYRGGTVEMMNSPTVIVAYLESATEYINIATKNTNFGSDDPYWTNFSWNSKKWRILIVVNEYGIFSVKGYPYQHEELTKIVMQMIADQFTEMNFFKTESFKPYRKLGLKVANNYFEINPHTNRMYNDFGSTDHYCKLNFNVVPVAEDNYIAIYFNYSGKSECMSCGFLSDHTNDFDTEGALTCIHCFSNRNEYACDCCGCVYDEEDLICVHDQLLCPDCFAEQCFEDALTYEYEFNEDGCKLFLEVDCNETYEVGLVATSTILYYLNDKAENHFKPSIYKGEDITINFSNLTDMGKKKLQSWLDFYKKREARKQELFF